MQAQNRPVISWLAALALCVLAVAAVSVVLREGDRSIDELEAGLHDDDVPADPREVHLDSLAEYAARGGDVDDLEPELSEDPDEEHRGRSEDDAEPVLTRMVPVATGRSEPTAELIAGMLRANGIPAELRSRSVGAHTFPRDTVVVPEQHAVEARSLVTEADAVPVEPPEPPEPPPMYR